MAFKNWSGQSAFVVGSGPSLTKGDCNKLKGKRIIAVNCSFRLLPFADVLYSGDDRWWDAYEHEWKEFEGEGWTSSLLATRTHKINHILLDSKKPLSNIGVSPGGCSGYHAINLAYLFKANPVYLLGFDCKPNGESNHWHQEHNNLYPFLSNPNAGLYKIWNKNIPAMHKALKGKGVDLINCSRDTALTIPRMNLEDAL